MQFTASKWSLHIKTFFKPIRSTCIVFFKPIRSKGIVFFKPPLLHAIFSNDIFRSSCIIPPQVFKGIISIIIIKVFILFKSFSTTS